MDMALFDVFEVVLVKGRITAIFLGRNLVNLLLFEDLVLSDLSMGMFHILITKLMLF